MLVRGIATLINATVAMHGFISASRCNATFHFCKSMHCVGCIFKNDDIVTAVLLRPCIAPLHFWVCEAMLLISLAFFQIWLHCYNFFLFANRYILRACFTVMIACCRSFILIIYSTRSSARNARCARLIYYVELYFDLFNIIHDSMSDMLNSFKGSDLDSWSTSACRTETAAPLTKYVKKKRITTLTK